jgi:hypothetical protein
MAPGRERRPARLLPGLLLLAGLTVSACGSSPVDAEAPKETIPLKEAETDRREVMQSAQQRFNACLDEAGYEFRGFVGDEGDAVVIEDRSYQEALQRCSGESGVTALRAEFAESRTSRTPDQIRQDNESILAVVACLRAGGMDLDDPVQDETGGLNLRSTLRSADVDPRGNEEARDCISEMWLRRQQQDG